jgi:hypothetical protein
MKVTKLEMHKYDLKKKKDEGESKFHRINKLCSGQQDGVVLDCATLYLNYASHLNDFHKRISRVGDDALTLRQLRDLFRSTLLRMQKVLDSEDPYSELIDGAKLMSESEEGGLTVDEIERRFLNVTAAARKKRLNAVAIAVVEGSRKKYQKDYDLLKKVTLPEERKITCSNRAVGKLYYCRSEFIHSLRIILFNLERI